MYSFCSRRNVNSQTMTTRMMMIKWHQSFVVCLSHMTPPKVAQVECNIFLMTVAMLWWRSDVDASVSRRKLLCIDSRQQRTATVYAVRSLDRPRIVRLDLASQYVWLLDLLSKWYWIIDSATLPPSSCFRLLPSSLCRCSSPWKIVFLVGLWSSVVAELFSRESLPSPTRR